MNASQRQPFRKKVTQRIVLLMLMMGIIYIGYSAAGALFPVAGNDKVYKKNGLVIDYSNADQGYIMVKYTKETSKRLKLYVKGADGSLNYKAYDLNNNQEYEIFPLQYGDGTYKIQLYRQVKGTSYSAVASKSIKVKLADSTLPFLYPNQYAWYTDASATVAKSFELCKDAQTDAQRVAIIHDYLTTNIMYDYIKAFNISASGNYLPDVDTVLDSRMGVCFDYAALMACMLRVQGIPTKLVIGYADSAYHAWNNVYIDGEWVFYDITAEAAKSKVKTYTVERWY